MTEDRSEDRRVPSARTEGPFLDRDEAGRQLAFAVEAARPFPDPLVLGLPRGGVPVAAHVAQALDAPLDVLIVRKLGMPGQRELAIGAVGPEGRVVLNEELVRAGGVSDEELMELRNRELEEIRDRSALYRSGRPPPDLKGRTVILVDDGLATGATMSVAVQCARRQGARSVWVAVPVASREALARLEEEADRVVCLRSPAFFMAVGEWYERFPQVSDEAVIRALEADHAAHP